MREIELPPLSKKAWKELRSLKIKMNRDWPFLHQDKVFDTYEEYVEDHKKNPPCALFG